jgi:MFS transporter, ACS family, glucarate transporter
MPPYRLHRLRLAALIPMAIPDVIETPFDSPPPSRARFVVLAYLCTMAFVLYLDRICMGQAAPKIQEELRLTNTQMSFVHMAFTLAYGLFEVPTGRWGDRFGSRRVLARIVIWWSAFTALTGACFRFWHLLLVRFLFGAGEAGAYPNAARVFSRWFPERERGRVQGVMLAFAQVGGALAPTVAAFLIQELGWRAGFFWFGTLGVLWAGAFYQWFRDDPREHSSVNLAEQQYIGPPRQTPHAEPIPWLAVVRHPSMWLLAVIMTMASFVSYMYFSWYPTYLQNGRGVSQSEAGLLTSLVLGLATLGTLAGGFVASWLATNPESRQRRRRWICFVSYAIAAAMLLVAILQESPVVSALCAGLSCFAMFSYQAHWWACVTELSGKHLGALFGLLNGLGAFGAMGSQFFFGAFADWRSDLGYTGRAQYEPAFYLYVGVLALTALCWGGVDTTRPLADESTNPTSSLPCAGRSAGSDIQA